MRPPSTPPSPAKTPKTSPPPLSAALIIALLLTSCATPPQPQQPPTQPVVLLDGRHVTVITPDNVSNCTPELAAEKLSLPNTKFLILATSRGMELMYRLNITPPSAASASESISTPPEAP